MKLYFGRTRLWARCGSPSCPLYVCMDSCESLRLLVFDVQALKINKVEIITHENQRLDLRHKNGRLRHEMMRQLR